MREPPRPPRPGGHLGGRRAAIAPSGRRRWMAGERRRSWP